MDEFKDFTIEEAFNLAIQNHQNNNLQDAQNYYYKVLEINPNYVNAHNNLGIIFKELGEYQKAKSCFERAIEIKSDYVDALNNLGIIFKELGEYQKAKSCFERAIKINPNYVNAHYNLGNIFKELGEYQKAESCFEKVIKIDPNYVNAHNNLGSIFKELGEYQKAESCFKKAIEIDPNYVNAHNNLGNIFKELGEYQKAESCFEKTIELKPNHEIANFYLGMILSGKRQHKNAIEYFKLSNFGMSKSFLLASLYQLDQQSNFYDHLDYLINKGDNNALIGSLISRSRIRYKISKPNPFCNEPLNYILKTDILKVCDFKNTFAKPIKDFLKQGNFSYKNQTRLINGVQTNGNIFNQAGSVAKEMQDIVYSEIEKYRAHFKDSEEGFLKNWPKNYTITGWIISMKNGGNLISHIHEYGWLSGSIYINVPPKVKVDSGNLVVGLDDQRQDSVKNTKSINVVTGSLCLFPSSLHHYTIPFEGEEERIVLAFDVLPD